MALKKEDIRIQKTRKLLCDAMFALLEKKSFDEISVVEICDMAMVHRATFYKHFTDKYDFMGYVTKIKLREFYDENIKSPSDLDPRAFCRSMTKNILEFVDKNRRVFRMSISSSGSKSFLESISARVYSELYDLLKTMGEGKPAPSVPYDVEAAFLSGGLCDIIRDWIISDDGYTKEQMTDYIETMLMGQRDSFAHDA